jgi:prepilin-type processing-associated H-X9-DG protein
MAACKWSGRNWNADTHCGPNDEIFGWHGSGANVVFMDVRAHSAIRVGLRGW